MTAESITLESSYWDTADKPPFDFYEEVQSMGGIAWDDRMRSWIVANYNLAQEVLKDDELFQHPYMSMKAGGDYMKIRSDNPRSSMFLKGEKHRAFHKWWLVELLSPKVVREYRKDLVDPWIDHLIKGLEDRPAFDLVEDFAERVPMGIFAQLLGLPQHDHAYLDHVKALNDAIGRFASVANALQLEGEASAEARRVADEAIAAAEELNDILKPLVSERKNGEGSDFISQLWRGGHRVFDDWNELDTLDACRRLLFAGVDTTTHAISNAFHMLLTDDSLMAQVRDEGSRYLDRFVEEVLRLNGSIQFRPRRASASTELNGKSIAQGDMLTVAIIGANRDPRHYGCPHAVDLERARPHDHLAFAYGPRTCLGAHLARAEIASAVSKMLARFPAMRLDPSRPAPAFSGFLMRSWRPLHVLAG